MWPASRRSRSTGFSGTWTPPTPTPRSGPRSTVPSTSRSRFPRTSTAPRSPRSPRRSPRHCRTRSPSPGRDPSAWGQPSQLLGQDGVDLLLGGLDRPGDGGHRDTEHPVAAPGERGRSGQPDVGPGVLDPEQVAPTGQLGRLIVELTPIALRLVAGEVLDVGAGAGPCVELVDEDSGHRRGTVAPEPFPAVPVAVVFEKLSLTCRVVGVARDVVDPLLPGGRVELLVRQARQAGGQVGDDQPLELLSGRRQRFHRLRGGDAVHGPGAAGQRQQAGKDGEQDGSPARSGPPPGTHRAGREPSRADLTSRSTSSG